MGLKLFSMYRICFGNEIKKTGFSLFFRRKIFKQNLKNEQAKERNDERERGTKTAQT